MTADDEVIRDRQVIVAESDGTIVGVVVLGVDGGAVHRQPCGPPSHQGISLGRTVLEWAEAEAQRAGFDAVHRYTHEKR